MPEFILVICLINAWFKNLCVTFEKYIRQLICNRLLTIVFLFQEHDPYQLIKVERLCSKPNPSFWITTEIYHCQGHRQACIGVLGIWIETTKQSTDSLHEADVFLLSTNHVMTMQASWKFSLFLGTSEQCWQFSVKRSSWVHSLKSSQLRLHNWHKKISHLTTVTYITNISHSRSLW